MVNFGTLFAIASIDKEAAIFNNNFRSVAIYGRSALSNLRIGDYVNFVDVCDDNNIPIDNVWFALKNANILLVVMSNETSFRIDISNMTCLVSTLQRQSLTISGIQSMCYNAIHNLTDHSKKAFNRPGKTLTLEQVIDRYRKNRTLE